MAPKLSDLVGKRIQKIKVGKTALKAEYISKIELEGGVSIILMPNHDASGRLVNYFELWGVGDCPRTWKQKLMDKAILILKLKLEAYEKRNGKLPEEPPLVIPIP